MSETMRGRTGARKYRRADAALSRYCAEGGSRSLAGAHAKELRVWASARHLITCYALPRAVRAVERLRACIAGVVQPVTPARVLTADAADQSENVAQTGYLLDPNPITRETWVRSLLHEAAESTALARDLDAEGRP